MSDAMDEVFGKRPKRPDHPDFWRISEILLANDGAMEAATGQDEKDVEWRRRVESVVDIESATYAGIQRALRLGAAIDPRGYLPLKARAAIAALWVDAFVTGAMYVERGGHQEPGDG